MLIQFKSFRFFPFTVSILLLLCWCLYRKSVDHKVYLIVDLRDSPNIGYYCICSANPFWRFADLAKEFVQQQILRLADSIYITKPELKYSFPSGIRPKIVVDKYFDCVL